MLHTLSAFTILYAFWLLLSGYFTPFLMASGVGCTIAVIGFARRMAVLDREGHPTHLGLPALLLYWPWLGIEIAKSSWDVTKCILNPALPISPTLTRFQPSQNTDLGLVIHANSITLTPGTISVEVSADEFLVHALTQEGAAGLAGSEMDHRVTAMMEKS